MALMMIEFHSNVLELNTNLYVIKPNILQDNEELKVLYLLHGYQGNYANWVKYTNLIRYVDGTNLLVVMPSGYNSFYVNHEIFGDYSKYVAEEIYELINKTFNIKQTRENTFVAGLSMGGYGALKTALSYPEKYSKAVGFSSVIKLENMIDRVKDSLRPKTELFLNKDTAKRIVFILFLKKALNKVELYFTCELKTLYLMKMKTFINTS